MWPGQPVPGSTTRIPINGGRPATHLTSITVRKVAGYQFHTLDAGELKIDTQGADLSQWRKMYVDWPSGVTEDMPIKATDRIIIGTNGYTVKDANPFPGKGIVVIVEIPQPAT